MITIKSEEEIKIMREGGKMLAEIMEEVKKKVQPGITTKELDKLAETLIFKSGAESAFKGYDNFPAAMCTSVNQVIVHGIPSDYELRDGDIISLDLGLKHRGFFSDMAITVAVGRVEPEVSRLIEVTKKSLKLAIENIRPGCTFGDIGSIIEEYVESQRFNVVRELCGHGIGKELHEDPQILNYREEGPSPEIKPGMVFCFEPMVTMGDWRIKKSSDGFGWETKDGSLSAHFEHMIAVTKTDCQVLTMK